MNDEDFERVLDRFDRRPKRGGGQISDETANRYRSKARDFREWLNEGEKNDDDDVDREWDREPKTIEEAGSIDVEDWYADLDEQYQTDSAVNKAKGAMAAFFSIANKHAKAGRIDIPPWGRETPADHATYSPETTDTMKEREAREDVQYLEPEQVDEMARATERLRDELIIRLLFQTGIRVTELCEIRLQDIDLDAREIRILGKGRKNRLVGYQASLDLLLDVWLDERRPAVFYADDSDYLFPTSHSENITRETVAEIVRNAAEEADLQEVYGKNTEGVELHAITPHVLRHSFAKAALDNEWNVYTLSQALGHESTEITTSTYLHDDEEQVRNAFRTQPVSTD